MVYRTGRGASSSTSGRRYCSSTAELILRVVLPLGLGSLIYLAWRSEDLWVFDWVAAAGGAQRVSTLRAAFDPWLPSLPQWLVFSLPDGLWTFAGTSWIAIIWSGKRRSTPALAWIAVIPALAIGGEVGQFCGFVPGRFDLMDLVFILLGALGGYLAWNPKNVP